MPVADQTAGWRGWRELVPALLVLTAAAVVVLGANPLRDETVAPMDLLQNEPGWHELALDLAPSSPYRSDVLDGLLPRWLFLKRTLRSGSLPSWNPLAGFGEPGWQLLFNGYLTPRFLMFVLFADAPGFYLGLLVQLLVAGLGAYLLARIFLAPAGSLCAAVTFMLCGFNVAWLMWPHTATAAMLPWVVWALWRVLGHVAPPGRVAALGAPRNARRRCVLLGGCVALLLVAGFPAVAMYGAYLCLGLVAGWLLSGTSAAWRPHGLRAALVAAAGGALGVGLAAVQLLPSLEFLRFFDLAERGPVGVAIDPRQLLLAPLPAGLAPDPETCGYVGLTALLLMVLGAVPPGAGSAPLRRFAVRFWTLAVVGSLVLALRLPRPLADLLYRLPGLSFNPNNRALVLFGLAAAMLAGIGLERLVAAVRCRGRRPRLAATAAAAVVVVAILAQVADLGRVSRAQNAIVPASAFLPQTSLTRWLDDHLEPGQGVLAEGFLTAGTLSSYGVREVFDHGFVTAAERRLLDHLAADAWVTSKAARPSVGKVDLAAAPWFDLLSVRYVVGPCAILRARFSPRAAAQMQAERPLTVTTGDLLKRPIPVTAPTTIGGVALLVNQTGPGTARLVSVLADPDGRVVARSEATIGGHGSIAWSELDLAAPLELAPGSYTLEVRGLAGTVAVWGTAGEPAYYLLEPLSLPPEIAAGWRLEHASHGLCVLANPDAPQGATLVEPDAELLRPVSSAAGVAAPLAVGDGSARYRVTSDRPRLLVRSTRSYPGWRVAVDGHRQQTLTAYGALQAVAVPAGESLVEWRFKPASVLVGVVVSLLAVIGTGLAWWWR